MVRNSAEIKHYLKNFRTYYGAEYNVNEHNYINIVLG